MDDGDRTIILMWTPEEVEQIRATANMMGICPTDFVYKAVEDVLKRATFTPANIRVAMDRGLSP